MRYSKQRELVTADGAEACATTPPPRKFMMLQSRNARA